MFQAPVHALVQVAEIRAKFFHVREVPAVFEHVRKEDDLLRNAHVRPARGVVADRIQHFGVLHAKGVLCEVRARKLVQNGRGDPFGRGEPRELGRLGREVFRRVVHRRRLHDLPLGTAVFARKLRREQRDAHRVLFPCGL